VFMYVYVLHWFVYGLTLKSTGVAWDSEEFYLNILKHTHRSVMFRDFSQVLEAWAAGNALGIVLAMNISVSGCFVWFVCLAGGRIICFSCCQWGRTSNPTKNYIILYI
jgi:hypothetical protein